MANASRHLPFCRADGLANKWQIEVLNGRQRGEGPPKDCPRYFEVKDGRLGVPDSLVRGRWGRVEGIGLLNPGSMGCPRWRAFVSADYSARICHGWHLPYLPYLPAELLKTTLPRTLIEWLNERQAMYRV